MVDFNKLLQKASQFGGIRLAIEYIKLGVLWIGLKELSKCVVNRQSFKQIYPAILRQVEPYLVDRYAPVVSRINFQDSGDYEHKRNKTVWFC